MRKVFLVASMLLAVLSVSAQDSPYIVKTKNVKKVEVKKTVDTSQQGSEEEEEPQDFMGKNFRFYSMCDWKEGMRFMVVPEKYDMLVNTFRNASNDKEVSSGILRHKIMVYKGHEDMPNGRVHVNFTCEDDQTDYYYELPNGTFNDYCYGKLGVPTLAYLGDVDKARELLMDQQLLTRTQDFRVDTEYDGDGFKEVKVDKNMVVTVKAIGVGTRSFPVKIIVEDEQGNQFYQNVAMSKTNCGMRDDEFIMDNEKFLFQGSFDYNGATMTVSENYKDYLNQTVHTKYTTSMSSKGSGKVRDIKVPRFTGFIIDEINPIPNSTYYTLTLREVESRRIYYKDVAFKESDVFNHPDGTVEEDFFGYIFGIGEGEARSTSKETRAAIREGRVIIGMSKDEVQLAMGEPFNMTKDSGQDLWMYARSNGVILDVWFSSKGKVTKVKARATKNTKSKTVNPTTPKEADDMQRNGGTWTQGTPVE